MSVSSAVKDAAQVAVNTGFLPEYVVYEAIVPDTPFPAGWATVYCDEGVIQRLTACGTGDSAKVTWQVSCFGSTNDVAGWLRTRIRDHLIAVGISVPGWTHGVVEHNFGQRPTADESVMEHPLVVAIDQYEMLISKL